jgi:hypothetical protein
MIHGVAIQMAMAILLHPLQEIGMDMVIGQLVIVVIFGFIVMYFIVYIKIIVEFRKRKQVWKI